MEAHAAETNFWKDVWTQPRAVIGWLAQNDPERHVLLLAALGGVSQSLGDAIRESTGAGPSVGSLFVMLLVVGPVGGILSMYVCSWFLKMAGQLLNGRATSEQIRTAYAWANVPLLAALAFMVVQFAIGGQQMLSGGASWMPEHPALVGVFAVLYVAEAICSLWAFVLFCKGVGEVQGFSGWTALASMILAVAIVVVPALVLVTLVTVLTG